MQKAISVLYKAFQCAPDDTPALERLSLGVAIDDTRKAALAAAKEAEEAEEQKGKEGTADPADLPASQPAPPAPPQMSPPPHPGMADGSMAFSAKVDDGYGGKGGWVPAVDHVPVDPLHRRDDAAGDAVANPVPAGGV